MTFLKPLDVLAMLEEAIPGRPLRPVIGAYVPCREFTPYAMFPRARGTPQSTFPAFCVLLRQVFIDIDTLTFLSFLNFLVHNACCATSDRRRPLQTAVSTRRHSVESNQRRKETSAERQLVHSHI